MQASVSNRGKHMGKLYVVATPIGNLDDMTIRAQQVLADVALIAAEDTRHTGILLNHFGIKTPMCSYHEHNEESVSSRIVDKMENGIDVALVSDAGTPQISDPGYRLVRLALNRGQAVVPVPGASALTAMLSVSGIPDSRFVFEGFLPAKAGQKKAMLQKLVSETRSMVFYEAPHRIEATLNVMKDVFGTGRQISLARELTKIHEQIFLGTVASALTAMQDGHIPNKGEFVIQVEGCDEPAFNMEYVPLMRELMRELPPGRAAEVASKLTGEPKNIMYRIALSLKKTDKD